MGPICGENFENKVYIYFHIFNVMMVLKDVYKLFHYSPASLPKVQSISPAPNGLCATRETRWLETLQLLRLLEAGTWWGHTVPSRDVHVRVSEASSQQSERVLQPWSSLSVTAASFIITPFPPLHDAIYSLHIVPWPSQRQTREEPWARITQVSHSHGPQKHDTRRQLYLSIVWGWLVTQQGITNTDSKHTFFFIKR